MTDTAYDNALKRQEELRKELAEIDQFLLLYRRFTRTGHEQVVSSKGSQGQLPQLLEIPAKIGPSEYAEMAERLIRDARRPLTRGDLADLLVKQGVTFPTDDVPRYLGTILWRNRDRFINVPGLGYAIPEIMNNEEYSKRILAANARSAEIDQETAETLFKIATKVADSIGKNRGTGPNDQIPPDIDRALLNEAGEELGRLLYEPEKINLRAAYKLAELLA